MQQYNKTKQKIIDFDDVTKKTQNNIIRIGQKFLTIHIEYQQSEVLDLEKQIHCLINHEPDIGTIYLYAKDSYEAKHKLLINKRKSIGLKYLDDSKVLLNTQMMWMIFKKY